MAFANATSTAYPPLQAALALMGYIQDNATLFKSNRAEIESIGQYSQQLSEQLERSAVDEKKAAKYIGVITEIRIYAEEVSKKKQTLQYLDRRNIERKLQGYRSSLTREYSQLLDIAIPADSGDHGRKEEAQRAEHETQEMIKQLSTAVKSNSEGICRLAKELGLPGSEASRKAVLRELQDVEKHTDPSTPTDEVTVLKESIHLTNSLLNPSYNWFRATFDSTVTESEVKDALAESVQDVIRDLQGGGLLARSTKTQLNHAPDNLRRIDILFRVLDGRSRDAILIRSFQRAVYRNGETRSYLQEGLELQ